MIFVCSMQYEDKNVEFVFPTVKKHLKRLSSTLNELHERKSLLQIGYCIKCPLIIKRCADKIVIYLLSLSSPNHRSDRVWVYFYYTLLYTFLCTSTDKWILNISIACTKTCLTLNRRFLPANRLRRRTVFVV